MDLDALCVHLCVLMCLCVAEEFVTFMLVCDYSPPLYTINSGKLPVSSPLRKFLHIISRQGIRLKFGQDFLIPTSSMHA